MRVARASLVVAAACGRDQERGDGKKPAISMGSRETSHPGRGKDVVPASSSRRRSANLSMPSTVRDDAKREGEEELDIFPKLLTS